MGNGFSILNTISQLEPTRIDIRTGSKSIIIDHALIDMNLDYNIQPKDHPVSDHKIMEIAINNLKLNKTNYQKYTTQK